MAFTTRQLRILALMPKISGFLSLVFSCWIIWTVLRDKKRRRQIYDRIMLGISCCDASASFWFALSTWPIPPNTNVVWAAGNDRTCKVQGFFTQASIASSIYNASLSVYYLLVIRHNFKESQLRRIEYLLHSIPLLWAIASASVGLVLHVYGNANLWCWCTAQHETFRWVAFYGPLWLMIAIVTINCILIFEHVRKVERSAQWHRIDDVTSSLRRASQLEQEAASTRRFSQLTEAAAKIRDARACAAAKEVIGPLQQTSATNEQLPLQHQGREGGEQQPEHHDHDIMQQNHCDILKQQLPSQHQGQEKEHQPGHHDNDIMLDILKQLPSQHQLQEEEEEEELPSQHQGQEEEEEEEEHQPQHPDHDIKQENNDCDSPQQERLHRLELQQQQRLQSLRRRTRRTREVANRCFLYAGAFYLNWLALTVARLLQTLDEGKASYPLLCIAAITVPIQGLPNFLVYLGKEHLVEGVWRRLVATVAAVRLGLRSDAPTTSGDTSNSVTAHFGSTSPEEKSSAHCHGLDGLDDHSVPPLDLEAPLKDTTGEVENCSTSGEAHRDSSKL